MCGRTALALAPSEIQQQTGTTKWLNQELYQPSYNVAPTFYQPVLVMPSNNPKSGDDDVFGKPNESDTARSKGEIYLNTIKWGIPIPSQNTLAINARDDRVMEGRGLWGSLRTKCRCVVIAEGFYEWLKPNHGTHKNQKKRPFYIKPSSGELLFMAGLMTSRDGNTKLTEETQEEHTSDERHSSCYAIVTTEVSNQLSFIHDRMPVILATSSDVEKWLNPNTPLEEALSLLQPLKEGLEVIEVSDYVSNLANQGSKCVVPLKEIREKEGIQRLFASSKKKDHDHQGDADGAHTKNDGQKTKIKRESLSDVDAKRKSNEYPHSPAQLSKKLKTESSSQSPSPSPRKKSSPIAKGKQNITHFFKPTNSK